MPHFRVDLSQSGERLPLAGTHDTIEARAVREGDRLTILVTNYAQPSEPIQTEQVQLTLESAQLPLSASIERIDADHAMPTSSGNKWIDPLTWMVHSGKRC